MVMSRSVYWRWLAGAGFLSFYLCFGCSSESKDDNGAGSGGVGASGSGGGGGGSGVAGSTLDGGGDVDAASDGNVPAVSKAPSPTIFSFRVEDGFKDRIYFDSSETISASDVKGFRVSGKTVSSVVINGKDTSGHYFIVSEAFNYWDNNTLRYEGGSDLQDTDKKKLIPFTLTYIENKIAEPKASVSRYVTNKASGGGDGKSEATAWTMSEAIAKAQAGMTIWIKAGKYTGVNLALKNVQGTAASPVKFKGYKTVAGDITKNYKDRKNYTSSFSSAEMPLFDGGNPTTGGRFMTAWTGESKFLFFENLQVQNYADGFHFTQAHHLVFRNINVDIIGDDTSYKVGISVHTKYGTPYKDSIGNLVVRAHPTRVKFLNNVVKNVTGNGIWSGGDFNLYRGNIAYNSLARGYNTTVSMDYYMCFWGSHNIQIENFCHRADGVSHDGYSFGARTDDVKTYNKDYFANIITEYNLIDGNESYGVGRPLKARNYGANYNVWKNNLVYGYGPIKDNKNGGISIFGGPKGNVFEGNIIHDTSLGIQFWNNRESQRDSKVAEDNIIRNNIFYGIWELIQVTNEDPTYKYTVRNNIISNNTIYDIKYSLYRQYAAVDKLVWSQNRIENNIFKNYVRVENAATFIPFTTAFSTVTHNRWDKNLIPKNSVNHTTDDPGFVDVNKGDLSLGAGSPKSVTEGANASSAPPYDFDGKERTAPYSLGAFEQD